MRSIFFLLVLTFASGIWNGTSKAAHEDFPYDSVNNEFILNSIKELDDKSDSSKIIFEKIKIFYETKKFAIQINALNASGNLVKKDKNDRTLRKKLFHALAILAFDLGKTLENMELTLKESLLVVMVFQNELEEMDNFGNEPAEPKDAMRGMPKNFCLSIAEYYLVYSGMSILDISKHNPLKGNTFRLVLGKEAEKLKSIVAATRIREDELNSKTDMLVHGYTKPWWRKI